jgi:serine protease inhibitor
MPPIQVTFEADLRQPIERLGVRQVFTLPARTGAPLRSITQKTQLIVDGNGIRTDTRRVLTDLGGTIVMDPPVRMILDRPFLFFVRDNLTKALLFEGAVMNPSLH